MTNCSQSSAADREEYLDIFDAAGNCIGSALRSECHGNPELLHHVSHVVVLHPESRQMLLQKRRKDKLIQPGKWDTAVGGHVDAGEAVEAAAYRELKEELGITVISSRVTACGDNTLNMILQVRLKQTIPFSEVVKFMDEHPEIKSLSV